MRLKCLDIRLETYGPDSGKYTGTASFVGQHGEVKIVLAPSASDAVLKLCAEALVENARDLAGVMAANILACRC